MKRVHRRQLAMTPACTFTDYHAQGQTIPRVIVDTAMLPSEGFNLYVTLFPSSGRVTNIHGILTT